MDSPSSPSSFSDAQDAFAVRSPAATRLATRSISRTGSAMARVMRRHMTTTSAIVSSPINAMDTDVAISTSVVFCTKSEAFFSAAATMPSESSSVTSRCGR